MADTDSQFARRVAQAWVSAFGSKLQGDNAIDVSSLFVEDASWRDLLVFSWDFSNQSGAEAITQAMLATSDAATVTAVALDDGPPPRIETHGDSRYVLAFFRFDCARGIARAFVRLSEDTNGNWTAQALITQLDELPGTPWRIGADRPIGKDHTPRRDRVNWSERRRRAQLFEDREPAVVILGAGHSGLALAARLGALDVDTLVLERNPNVGDNWRNRYASLALHDAIHMDDMPYMALSPRWTKFTPKDKFGNFLEYYAEALEINAWTGTEVTSAKFDLEAQRWVIELRRADGIPRVVRPRHFVLATGLNGEPRMPTVPGIPEFEGTVIHSAHYTDGSPWRNKNVMVVGAGVSGHDIAQDLWENGANVTLVQRSSTYVINVSTFHELFFGYYVDGAPYEPEDADLISATAPFGSLAQLTRPLVDAAAQADAQTLRNLEERGFRTNVEGMTGHFSGYDGYYINVGASDLIIDGSIKVEAGCEIERLEPRAAVMTNGAVVHADLIVFATGYGRILDSAHAIIHDIHTKVSSVYMLQDDGEMSSVWRRTGCDGLWFMTGTIATARFYSKLLALQIKAIEQGLMPYEAKSRGEDSTA